MPLMPLLYLLFCFKLLQLGSLLSHPTMTTPWCSCNTTNRHVPFLILLIDSASFDSWPLWFSKFSALGFWGPHPPVFPSVSRKALSQSLFCLFLFWVASKYRSTPRFHHGSPLFYLLSLAHLVPWLWISFIHS